MASGGVKGKSGSRNSPSKIKENTEVSKHLHEGQYGGQDEMADRETRISWVMEDAGLSRQEAEKLVDNMVDWSGGDLYLSIRDAQAEGKETIAGQRIENYISKAPKYEGQIFRGIAIDETEDVETIISVLKAGEQINMNGTSSWTSDKRIAEMFAQEHGTGILFVSQSPKMATSVQHLSHWGTDENEVISSKRVKYSASKITYNEQADFYTIYVDEHI